MAVEALGDKPSGLSMMLDIVDMCKLLDYEIAVCIPNKLALLPRSYFEISDDKASPNSKFYYLRCLVLWLLSLNKVKVESKGDSIYIKDVVCCENGVPREDSNNVAVSTVLLDACKSIGVTPDGASPLRIKAGWGEPVCMLLHALLKQTMSARNVTLIAPKHDLHSDADDDIQGV